MNESSNSIENKEIPLLTFNSLYTVLREEKKTQVLSNLPENFYDSLKNFVNEKKKEIQKLKLQNNSKEKLKKEMNVYRNSQKISKELISLRLVKISNVAIKNGVYGEEMLTKGNVLPQEEEMFKKIENMSKETYEKLK